MNPQIAISYSHDSDTHREWVLQLASALIGQNIDVILDQWNIRTGDDIGHFMETAITQCQGVIVVVTENYISKADAGIGGVGYEKRIIAEKMMSHDNPIEVFPLLKGVSNQQKLPRFLSSLGYLDFSKPEQFSNNIEMLVGHIQQLTTERQERHGKLAYSLDQGNCTSDNQIEANQPSSFNSIKQDYQEYIESIFRLGGTSEFLIHNAPLKLADWQELAEMGNAEAQQLFGRCLIEGVVVTRDPKKAVEYFRRSADQGNDSAMLNLGYSFDQGEGVEQDKNEALRWYNKAAKFRNPIAMNNLGCLFKDGVGTSKPNYAVARHWFEKAADEGFNLAFRNLANMYLHGQGVPQDESKAQELLGEAEHLGDAYTQGRRLARQLENYCQQFVDSEQPLDSDFYERLDTLIAQIPQLHPDAIKAFFSTLNFSPTVFTVRSDDSCTEINKRLNPLYDHYITCFKQASTRWRIEALDSFSKAFRNQIERRHKENDSRYITQLWLDCLDDIDWEQLPDAENELIDLLRFCIISLFHEGYQAEAHALLNQTMTLCARILENKPWEWYLKRSFNNLCFEVGALLKSWHEETASQRLLRQAWTMECEFYGLPDFSNEYPQLPTKGNLPHNCKEAHKPIFLAFNKDNTKGDSHEQTQSANLKRTCVLRKYSVPCQFGNKKSRFDFYIVSGKNGYRELLDQYRWLKERRGGIVPAELCDSFRKLYELAEANQVSFPELTTYALNKKATSDKKNLAPAES